MIGKPKLKRLSATEIDMIHDYVLKHSIHTEELLGYVSNHVYSRMCLKLCLLQLEVSHVIFFGLSSFNLL